MDFKDIGKSVELYKNGMTIDEINKILGTNLTADWIEEIINQEKTEKYNGYKYIIFKLQKQQKLERDNNKRRQLLLELKDKLKGILEIVPDDIDMQTKLMYTDISLKDLNEARIIGNKLLEQTDSNDVLNGIAIIEEKSGNYETAIQMIDRILEREPNNEYYKNKKQKIQQRKENNNSKKKNKLYAQIATLERSARKTIEEKQQQFVLQDKKVNTQRIKRETHKEIYTKVKEIAETILAQFPNEVVAKEKLIKSLYIIGKKNEARIKAEDLLQSNDNDEIALWFMSRIARDKGKLEIEKKYLDRLAQNTEELPLQILQRIEEVRLLISEKQQQQNFENLVKETTYTENDRERWLENIQKEFQYGKITKNKINEQLEEAKKYPNFVKSMLELLDIESKITENSEEKIKQLEAYLDTEYSITREEYKEILNEITETRRQIEAEKTLEKYYNNGQNNGDER